MTEHKINNIIVQFGLLCEIYRKFKAGSHMTIITSNYFRTSDRMDIDGTAWAQRCRRNGSSP